MKITIKTSNIDLTPAIHEYIEEKIGGLEKFIPDIDSTHRKMRKGIPLVEAWVEVGRTTRHHHTGDIFRAEVDMRLPGKILRAEAEEWDLHVAIDTVKDELQRELKKYKGKQGAKYRRGARVLKKFLRFSNLARFWREGRVREEGR